jgi:hypothetical protein
VARPIVLLKKKVWDHANGGCWRRRRYTRLPPCMAKPGYGTPHDRDRRFPAADQERITQALDLASRLHAADRRQNEPYVNHLLRVAPGSSPTTASVRPM